MNNQNRLNYQRGEYEEIKVTKYFKTNNKKYRVSYVSKNSNSTLSIKITNGFSEIYNLLIKIFEVKLYKKIKIYLKENIDDVIISNFINNFTFDGYHLEFSSTLDTCDSKHDDLLCVFVKD
ncbi:hypothetical protein HERIO_1021 [Hepatospora eriocheir]|uniref:Uncharacterized protein n=1 Tax=Hepatospora eriocheir TaxID=1081669 RepID=A0A1X0QBC8_9MICR|nr:hypothetical protein HERIO_1021 [Hepatospora eriocheir]